jgi:hypothetical protein
VTGTPLGNGSPLQPVAGAANGVIDSIHAGIEDTGHQMPVLNDPLHQVINLGTSIGLGALGEGDNLLTNVADLPGDVLSGNVAGGLGGVTGSAGHVVDAAGGVLGSLPGLVDGVLSGDAGTGAPLGGVTGGGATGGVLAPVTSILDGVTGGGSGSPVDGVLAPVTSILGGVTGGGATHPLIDVSAGPTTASPIADVSLLAPQSDTSHAIQIGAIGVGADQPTLVNANLLGGDSLPLPATGAGGADSLVGQVLDIVHGGTGGPVDPAPHSGIDLGIAAIDVGGLTDLHHADPTPHGATGGLHLLGL